MILTTDEYDVNYSELVQLVDLVIVEGTPIKDCVYVDTVLGKYICYTDPLRVVNGRSLTEEKYAGKIEVTFKGSQDLIDYYLDEINNKIQN